MVKQCRYISSVPVWMTKKRGGDIDLLVRSTGEKKGVLARIRMTARLKLHLGDQKIDVIGDHEDSPVVQEALKNGIQLIWQKRKFTELFFAWNGCYRHFEWTVFQKCLQRQQTRLRCDTGYSFPKLFFYNINFVTKLSRGSKRI